MVLLKASWNELLVAGFSYKSVDVRDAIVLAPGYTINKNTAHQVGLEVIFDRVVSEVVCKMREIRVDKTEAGCLKCIILFNPGWLTLFLFFSKFLVLRSYFMNILKKHLNQY